MQRTHVLRRAMPPTAVLLVCFVSATLVGVAGVTPSARGQTIENEAIRWNAIASTAIIAAAPTGAGQAPQAAVLSLAMVQGAVYDAVNAIDGGHQPYLVAPAADPGDSKEAAAATAAFRVLVGFPAHAAADGLVPEQLDAPAALRRVARGGARRAGEDGRDRGRRGGRGRDADEPAGRRPLRVLHVRARHRSRRLAARLRRGSERDRRGGPGPLGRLRPAVPGPERRHAPDRRPERRSRAPTTRRTSTRSSSVGSLTSTEAHRRSDGGGDLLAGQRGGDLEPRLPLAGAEPGARHRRQRPPLRDDGPGRGGRLDRLLERQGLLELLAADHRDPGGGGRRQPGDQGRPDVGAALRPDGAGLRAPRS